MHNNSLSPECDVINGREKPYIDLLKQDLAWEKYRSLCLSCKGKRREICLLPCHHLAVCKMCMNTTYQCPIPGCQSFVANATVVKQ